MGRKRYDGRRRKKKRAIPRGVKDQEGKEEEKSGVGWKESREGERERERGLGQTIIPPLGRRERAL